MPSRFLFCLFLFLLPHTALLSQSLPQLQLAVESLHKNPDMRSASWSITVIDLANGNTVLTHDGDRSLVTASTMKVVTTATALALLGPDYRFQTYLEYDGTLKDGLLDGNLYIRGEGDPSLGSHRFAEPYQLDPLMIEWAALIGKAGIKQIKGKVMGDESLMGTQLTPGNWNWEDMGNYYGAGAGGLNIHENFYRLDLRSPGPGGQTTVVRTEPNMAGLQFINEVKAGASGTGDNAYIFGAPYTWQRYVRGTIPPNRSAFSIKGSIPDPALFAARRLTEELVKCGIPVAESASSVRLETIYGRPVSRSRTLIHTHASPLLSELVVQTNMESINLYAEALALRASIAAQKPVTTADAANMMESYWKGQGVSTRGMNLKDGSGLSPNNVMSTSQMAKILYLVSKTSYADPFRASLPVAGRTGSLKSMLLGTAAEGKLQAKSGFLSGVRSYAGYVKAANGKEYAFSMIANQYSCGAGQMRRYLEQLMVKLAEGR